MANYDTLKATIDAYIRANGVKAITGPVLNGILNAMVDSLGTGFQFMGEAKPSTDPGRPDQNVAYIAATAGTYEDFANLTLPSGKVGLFTWDGSWHLTVLDIPTEEAVPTKTSDILNDSGFITNAVADLANYYLKTETYTAAQVDQLVASLTHIEFVVAPSLPTASAATMNKIYLVPSAMPSSGDVKDEFVTLKNGNTYTWEQIGQTTVDLSNYPTIAEMNAAIDAALTTIVSGVTVTVDASVGTPSATVTFSGGIMSFAFHNLKGETGAQGPQGNTGSSVDYPYELVNNLTTDDATKGLSAAQGVVLEGEISQLEAKVDEFATGKFYGNFASSEDLPEDADVEGFAYVGESLPYSIYNFNGSSWVDSGVKINERPDTINTIVTQEIAGLGAELVSENGWILGTGWSGDLANGFAHASGNTAPLTFAMPVATGTKIFQITFRSSVDATDTNILVSIGNSETFPLYGQPQPYGVGIKSVSDGNLVFTPESSFTGTLTEISIKEVISETDGVRKVIDSNEQIAFETRSTLANLRNIFIGLNAGKLNTSGYGNVAVGALGLQSNTSGFWNIAIGREALYSNTVGSRNVAVGFGALSGNISGNRNIAIGSFSLLNNTTGNHNISIGADCMNNNTSGGENVAIGFQAMYQSTSSRYNVAIGHNAMSSIKTGQRNVAIGFGAGASLESGNYNLFIGSGAGQYTTSNNNIAIGFGALYRNTGGQNNVAIGHNAAAGGANASWAGNTFIGTNTAPSIKTGIVYNTFIGYGAGQNLQSGGYNILIGYNVGVPTSTKSYHLNIGNLITGDMTSGSEFVKINGGLDLSSIPTTDPGVSGRVWNDNGILKISQ